MHILFYEQAVCKRFTKTEKKVYLKIMNSKRVIVILTLLYNGRVRDIFTIQLTEANRDWEWSSGTVYKPSTGHAHSKGRYLLSPYKGVIENLSAFYKHACYSTYSSKSSTYLTHCFQSFFFQFFFCFFYKSLFFCWVFFHLKSRCFWMIID